MMIILCAGIIATAHGCGITAVAGIFTFYKYALPQAVLTGSSDICTPG